MGNISDEIKILDAEIEKVEKSIGEEVKNYNEARREGSDHFQRCGELPPGEAREILVNAGRGAYKRQEASKHTIKALQSRLNTLKQSRENKLNKIVFREDLEEVNKLQKEAEELKQRRTELSAKYAKPKKSGGWFVSDDKQEVCLNGKTVTKLSNIPYKLFVCLLNKKGKFVKTKTLEKCWDREPGYDKFLVDAMGKLKATLKEELTEKGINIQGEIIESQKNDKRKIIAYKLSH